MKYRKNAHTSPVMNGFLTHLLVMSSGRDIFKRVIRSHYLDDRRTLAKCLWNARKEMRDEAREAMLKEEILHRFKSEKMMRQDKTECRIRDMKNA
ncbi:hypothetical protein [Pantoea sp. A4]|uniref:hypothetical protein n=1 Tax=Pantoea sp. A4 TaxID=1225184 RepID=UPI000474D809|nr:hypothetical protein [Pantoea sp. A4]